MIMGTSMNGIQSLLFRLTVKKNQLLWRGQNSRPYLSSDLFVSLCDYSYLESRGLDNFEKLKLTKAESIFCRSDLLENFLENYSELIKAKILVCGRSDRDFIEVPSNLPTTIRALFLQNSFVSDNEFIYTLPIGLENLCIGINGDPKLLISIKTNPKTENKILAGPYSLTHPVREEFANMYGSSKGVLTILQNKLLPKKYAQIVSNYFFVLALRGNGVDTHRFWETLYRGGIPIVIESPWSKSLCKIGIPLIEISDMRYETIAESVQLWNGNRIPPKEIRPLWEDFWIELFNSKISRK